MGGDKDALAIRDLGRDPVADLNPHRMQRSGLPATCEEIGESVAAKNPEFLDCSAVDKYRNGLYRQERGQNVLVHPCQLGFKVLG